jgi:hypothetical protein
MQLIGGVAHGGHDHYDGMACLPGRSDTLRNALDAVRVGD